jgi:uncharacterized protein (TIGR02246 family)
MLWLLALPAVACGYAARGEAADRPKSNPRDEAAIQKTAEAFVEAFHKGDAKAVAAFWTPDGDYTDPTGRHLQGRTAIEKAFADLFSENKGLKVHVHGLSLRFLTPEVAVEEGTSEVFPPDGGPPSRARYTNVLVKRDSRWLLGSVAESPFTPPGNGEHLRGLGWALGEWAGRTTTGEEERLALGWSANENFVVGSFATASKDVPVASAAHWIAWDPLAKRVRSWIFDDSGAFGEGTWDRDGDRWTVKTSLVLPDGKKAAAKFVLARVDADTIALKSKERSVDGKPLPDTNEVMLKRVK